MPSLSCDCSSLHTRDFPSDRPLGAERCSVAPILRRCPSGHPAATQPAALAFFVSKDEEYVRAYALRDGTVSDLGARSHNYLLLLLARQAMSDAAEGLPRGVRGWMHPEELAHDLQVGLDRLNLHIFRIREHLAGRGISPGRNIVERRPGTRQVRLGVRRVAVWTP